MVKKKSLVFICIMFTVVALCLSCTHRTDAADVMEDSGINIEPRILSLNGSNLLTVREDGTVWGIHHNEIRQALGWYTPPEGYQSDVLRKIEGLENIIEIDTDTVLNLAVDSMGDLWWFMFDEAAGWFAEPVKINEIDQVKKIYISSATIVAIKMDGTVWTGGVGKEAFGISSETFMTAPKKIEGLKDIVCASIEDATCYFVDIRGEVYCAELGEIYKISGLENVKKIENYTLLKNDGTLWRLNYRYEADRDFMDSFYLEQLEEVGNIVGFTTNPFTFALDDKNNVWVIEYNKGIIFDIDQEVVVWEDDFDSTDNEVSQYMIYDSRKIYSDAKAISSGSNRIAYINNDGTLWYQGESFEPLTDYELNNPDFEITNKSEESDIYTHKTQIKPKQLKFENGNDFNIYDAK